MGTSEATVQSSGKWAQLLTEEAAEDFSNTMDCMTKHMKAGLLKLKFSIIELRFTCVHTYVAESFLETSTGSFNNAGSS